MSENVKVSLELLFLNDLFRKGIIDREIYNLAAKKINAPENRPEMNLKIS